MKAQDLRIGNKIFYRNKAITVNWQELKWIQEGNNNFQPIPLTEEILLKCGFEFVRNNDEPFYQLIKNGIVFNSDYLSVEDSIDCVISTVNSLVKFKYLHQLQNIFFALTNEELTINL